ncbi:copine-like protein [Phytophthora cinnamomi]|uniref:copine-like protein n=1 Tax=Phytophthora cinnamomi TaxID=4785 RepID=UPI003559B465|nr:copine-like protein [Phytophthora cinnamomi]
MYTQLPPVYGRERSLSSPSAPPVDTRNLGYQVTPQAPPEDRRGSFHTQQQAPLFPNIGQQQNYGQPPPNYAPQQQNYGQPPQNYAPQQNYGQPQQNYAGSQQNLAAPVQQQPAPFQREPTLHGGYGPVQPGSFESSRSSMALMPDGMAPTPSSVVELRFRCKGLKKSDLLSQSDPFIVLYMQEAQKRGWREIGRTETIQNTPDPTFAKSFQVDFFFEEVQRLRVEVFDRDSSSERLSDHDFLGCVEITMGQLMSSQGQSAILKLLQNDKNRRHVHNLSGHVVIDAEEVSTCADMINVRFTATKLDNKDGWFGASDPFLNIYRLRDENADPLATTSWILVWRSEVIMNNCDPKWRRATLSVQTLCNGNLSRLLKIECMDWEKNGKHQFIGSCTVKAAEFVTGEIRSMDLINRERQAKKGKKYKNSGVLVLEQIELFKRHTFAEYLRGGCEVSLIVGIDYTASNGSPSDPSSLHYTGASYQGQLNDYQAAISATGAILEPYDSDKRFPVYGFGGLVNGAVNHCFPLTFDPTQPEVEGINGIMSAYSNSFQFVQLHGPTLFAPLVHQAAAIARTFSAPSEQGGGGNLKYFVLLIITDGAIMDMQQTIDELVQASTLPLSIVIVAVGNADFTAMNALDSDDKLLVDSRRIQAARDIVQFVPFNQFRRNPARLAKETLAEIPTQLLQYYNMKGIQPRTPLQRQGTSYLVSSSVSSGLADALDVEV